TVTKHLHAGGDQELVRSGREPLLLDLFADKNANRFGTHFHRQWFIFDQLVISPGMLDDRGWSCDPDSVSTVRTTLKERPHGQAVPWSFGTEHDRKSSGQRGYSDHLPVTVKLRVAAE